MPQTRRHLLPRESSQKAAAPPRTSRVCTGRATCPKRRSIPVRARLPEPDRPPKPDRGHCQHRLRTHSSGRYSASSARPSPRHAIAERLNDPGNLAIFSYEHDCDDGLEFGAEQVSINGFVHSNGQFRISHGPFWAADGTVSRNNCPSSVEPDIYSQFGDAPPLNRLPRDVFDTLNWPAWFIPADFGWLSRCTYAGRTIRITSQRVVISQPRRVIRHSGVLPSGTYCATQSLTMTGDGLSGSITALAPSVTVDAPHSTLRPYSGTGVLFFAVPNTDLDPDNDGSLAAGGNPNCQPASAADMSLTGEDVRWRGVIFSPCGRIIADVGGSTVALDGVMIGQNVRVDRTRFLDRREERLRGQHRAGRVRRRCG